jgi:hypothetical protein
MGCGKCRGRNVPVGMENRCCCWSRRSVVAVACCCCCSSRDRCLSSDVVHWIVSPTVSITNSSAVTCNNKMVPLLQLEQQKKKTDTSTSTGETARRFRLDKYVYYRDCCLSHQKIRAHTNCNKRKTNCRQSRFLLPRNNLRSYR